MPSSHCAEGPQWVRSGGKDWEGEAEQSRVDSVAGVQVLGSGKAFLSRTETVSSAADRPPGRCDIHVHLLSCATRKEIQLAASPHFIVGLGGPVRCGSWSPHAHSWFTWRFALPEPRSGCSVQAVLRAGLH